MKMRKILSIVLAAAMLMTALCLASCQSDKYADITARVYTLKGPTGMGMSKLMSDNENGKTEMKYDFNVVSSPTEISPEVIGGRFDIAAVPVNLAATLFNKGADISLVAVNTLGVLYVLENGNEINSISDLRGKTIYATGQGSTPEYIFNYLLDKNGIGRDEVEFIFCSDGSEVASNLVAGKASVGLIPEPNVTAALSADTDGDLRIALDITAEWNKVSDTPVVQGVIIASNKFISENPGAIDEFLKEYKNSVEYINDNIEEASALIEKYGIVPKAAVAKKALPNCNICCYTGAKAVEMANDMMNVLYSANPSSIGGSVPGDAFWYEK